MRGRDHAPNQSDGRLFEPGGSAPGSRNDRPHRGRIGSSKAGPPEAAQHCPRLGLLRTIGKRSPQCGSDGASRGGARPAHTPSMPTSQQEGQEGLVPTRTPMRPARDRGPRRGLREVPPRLRRVLVAPEGVRLGVRTARSHITGPIRGQGKGHATTGPGARRSGSPGQVSPGSRWGAQDRSSGNPELGRSQGEQTPGRWTRDGWGPPALGGLTNAAQSITGPDSDPGLRLDRGAVHGKAPPGLGSGSGQGTNPGSSWPTPVAEGPRPGHAPQGRPTTAEPHPGPH